MFSSSVLPAGKKSGWNPSRTHCYGAPNVVTVSEVREPRPSPQPPSISHSLISGSGAAPLDYGHELDA